MDDTTRIEELTSAVAERFTRLSDAIWALAETRWEERESMELQIAVAEKFGFRVERGVGGVPTAFAATRGETGPTIAALGEYDALAGLAQTAGSHAQTPREGAVNGHGCGHNLLGSGSLLASVVAAQYLEETGTPGRVQYFGCPAEEAAAGKTYMVKAGAFDGVDAAVTWHPHYVMSASHRNFLAYFQAYFHFSGVSAHAALSPHLGRSALDAVELVNVGLNFLREHVPDSARIHYAITDAGGLSPNVVQASATGYYVVRAQTLDEARKIYERLLRIAEGAALMTDTTLEVEFDGACANYLINDSLEQVIQQNFEHIGGVPFDEADEEFARGFGNLCDAYPTDELTFTLTTAGMDPSDAPPLHSDVAPLVPPKDRLWMSSSTDVGDVSWVTPTGWIWGATGAIGTPFHSWQLVSQAKSPLAHKGMVQAAKVLAASIVDLASQPDLLRQVRAEFVERESRAPYVNPIPDGCLPPPGRTAR